MFIFITVELMIVLSRPMLINVNNAFGKCPNKTDVLTEVLLGSQLDIQLISHLFWVWMAELFLNLNVTAPATEATFWILQDFVAGYVMQCLGFALCVLQFTQSLSTVVVSLCLTEPGSWWCVEINVELLPSQWQRQILWLLWECSFLLGECHRAGIQGISALLPGVSADLLWNFCQTQLLNVTFCRKERLLSPPELLSCSGVFNNSKANKNPQVPTKKQKPHITIFFGHSCLGISQTPYRINIIYLSSFTWNQPS